MPTVGEVFEQHRGVFGSVPSTANDFVCPHCVGPKPAEYEQCYGCLRLLKLRHEVAGEDVLPPLELRDRIVPMTTALNPSTWYAYLLTYKRGRLDDLGPALVALTFTFLSLHEAQVRECLDGAPDCLTIVPSKQHGIVFGSQPLVRALGMVRPLRAQLVQTLVYVQGAEWQRQTYYPDRFQAGPTPVRGRRVLLLEDAWVAGGTAVSAAGALVREGASAVLIMPIARVVNRDDAISDPEGLYRKAMTAPYDPDNWPRIVERPGWIRR